MQILTHDDLEDIANRTLTNYQSPNPWRFQQVDILGLLTKHLNLNVRYELLSEDGSILGLTTFEDMDIEIWSFGVPMYLRFMKGTVLIDKRLRTKEQHGRHRFTLAHEGAHHILSQMYPDYEMSCANRPDKHFRALRTIDDWMEWQADTLASCLLMPEALLELAMQVFCDCTYLEKVHPILYREKYNTIRAMSEFLGVSRAALCMRLKRLGFLGHYDFKNPTAFMHIAAEG